MATEEVVGDEIRSVDKNIIPKDGAETSYEDTNMAKKQGQEFELDGTCNAITCSCLSADEDDDDDDYDFDDDEELNSLVYDELSVEDEAQRLLKEIKIAIELVKDSKFYANLTEQIKGDAFQSQLKRVLGSSYSQLNMVIYALGCLEFGFNPHYQLAIALLLKQDFSRWIGGIEVYDPVFSPADVIVLKELGCEVLLVNERCRRRVEKPTLFYMPHAHSYLVGDLLEANWRPSRINQLILLDTSFKYAYGPMGKNSRPVLFFGDSEDYMKAILDHTKEIFLEVGYGSCWENIFNDFAFHFFEVDSQLDMKTLITDEDGKLSETRLQSQRARDMSEPTDFLWMYKCSEKFFEEPFTKNIARKRDWTHTNGHYRGPRKYRCSWNPPPEGWIKLNFGGRGPIDSNNLAGFGGICHNESKKAIFIYQGALGKVDQTTACVEALIFGLTELLKIPNTTRNLIVEGDDLRVIQWANKREHERPAKLHEFLNRVLDLLREFNSVIYHIYEEANLIANNLAKKGAISGNHVYVLGQYSQDLEDVDNLIKCLKLVD